RRAVDAFGFHLAAIDLRQNADVHERVVGELLATSGVSGDYRRAPEEARLSLLRTEVASARPLASPHLSYSDETAAELSILLVAAEGRRLYGPDAIRHCIISKTSAASDILEQAVLLKDVGLLHPREAWLELDIVPLFETIDDLRRCSGIMDLLLAVPEYR